MSSKCPPLRSLHVIMRSLKLVITFTHISLPIPLITRLIFSFNWWMFCRLFAYTCDFKYPHNKNPMASVTWPGRPILVTLVWYQVIRKFFTQHLHWLSWNVAGSPILLKPHLLEIHSFRFEFFQCWSLKGCNHIPISFIIHSKHTIFFVFNKIGSNYTSYPESTPNCTSLGCICFSCLFLFMSWVFCSPNSTV